MIITNQSLIFTNHALSRLKDRQFSQEQAESVFSQPDHIKPGKKSNTWEYIKRVGKQTITLIVTNNNQDEKIVISAWIDPPVFGTADYQQKQRYQEYHRAGPLKKIWLIIKEQFGF